jgi:ABC-type transport system substrate-binding protein
MNFSPSPVARASRSGFCIKRFTTPARFVSFVCFVGALLAFTGCGKRETTVELGNREGVLHLSIGSEPSDLDPQTVTGTGDAKIIQSLFEPLVSYETGTLAPVPALAERWEISADGLTYTFQLRDGLEWHDGTPVTSADCIASIARFVKRDPTGLRLAPFIQSMDAVDAKRFKLVLKESYGLVLETLAKPSLSPMLIMPKRVAETSPAEPIKPEQVVGSGPFIFKRDEWKPGEKVVYVRNPKYKPRAEPPSGLAGGKVAMVERDEWLAISDPQTALTA